VEHWKEFAAEVLAPIPAIPKHPFLMARFGRNAFFSAKTIAHRFGTERTRALFAGLAAHSFLKLTEPLSGAFGLMMAVPAHAVGWPIPRGGAQSLTHALCQYFASLGGTLHTSRRIAGLRSLPLRRDPATVIEHFRKPTIQLLQTQNANLPLRTRRIQNGLRTA